MGIMFQPYAKYFDFSGRARRKEFWLFLIYYAVCGALLTVISGALRGWLGSIGLIVLVVFHLGSIIPLIAVGVRRLHDTNRSGWWYLIQLIPFGGFLYLIFCCFGGNEGDNKYGPDPKQEIDASIS